MITVIVLEHFHSTATMLSSNQEILEYMAENLMHYMNPTLLVPQLKKQGLLTEEDAGQSVYYFSLFCAS